MPEPDRPAPSADQLLLLGSQLPTLPDLGACSAGRWADTAAIVQPN